MVAKIAFLLLAGFAVVYSAPAGFGFDSIFDLGQDIFQQVETNIQDAGKSVGDSIKGGLNLGNKAIEQGIKIGKGVVQEGQKAIGNGIKIGEEALHQGQEIIHKVGQSIGNNIKGGLGLGHKVIEQGIKIGKGVVHQGQKAIGNGIKIGEEALQQGHEIIHEVGQSIDITGGF